MATPRAMQPVKVGRHIWECGNLLFAFRGTISVLVDPSGQPQTKSASSEVLSFELAYVVEICLRILG